ncbi:hypothetical protein [Rhodoferax sp. OV413]|uniref:hypothetical protein n=1 Tax=Rhodoferax sp. OV413 TaxID=1855285 RepID=UPI00115FC8BF|nr:hypothetical protein [Rhodoferax sp. OV413]
MFDCDNPFCENCGFDLKYGVVKVPTSGQCIYCQQVEKLTDEHIFGKWLIKALGRVSQYRFHSVGRPERLVFWEPVDFHRSDPLSAVGDLLDSTVRNVCERCNTTWMSDIHKIAQPLVLQLVKGGWQVHSHEECIALSRWVAMVAINLECHGRILKTTQHQRTALMNGHPLDGWQVSFGNLRDSWRRSYVQSIGVPLGMGTENTPLHINNAYFCIDRAVFHARSSISNGMLQMATMAVGLSGARLPTTPLWPSSGRPLEDLLKGVNLSSSDVQALTLPGGSVQG